MKHRLFILSILSIPVALMLSGCRNSEANSATDSSTLEILEQSAGINDFQRSGEEIYRQECLTCHQANGGGVPYMAPSLIGSEYLKENKGRMIGIVLHGFSEETGIVRQEYSNPMPPFKHLTDSEIADLLNYVTKRFANSNPEITPEEVKAKRNAK